MLDINLSIQCSACKFIFDSTFYLLTHLRNLSNDEFHRSSTFVCLCSLKFESCDAFVDHLISHRAAVELTPKASLLKLAKTPDIVQEKKSANHVTSDARLFKCNECDAVFARNYNLKQHSLIHNRQSASTFNCSVCQKTFFSRSALKLHFRIHNKFTPFKCEFSGCAESFRTRKLMTSHVRRTHFAIRTTNKREYSALDSQRLVRRIAELSGKTTINEELPLKKSANSAFSSLPIRRPPSRQQRQLGRASLDITQHSSFCYNTNCIQMSSTGVIPRRVGSASNFFVPIYGFHRNNGNA